jgi:hypothetical protein
MDFVNKFTGGNNNQQSNEQSAQGSASGQQQQSGSGGGFLGGIGDKLNSAAGGGKESEKNEDYLDKGLQSPAFAIAGVTKSSTGVDFVQEKFLGAGPQDNESAVEQAKDEQISDYIRSSYKSATGSDVPIKDKVCSTASSRSLTMLTSCRRRGSVRAKVSCDAQTPAWHTAKRDQQDMRSAGYDIMVIIVL